MNYYEALKVGIIIVYDNDGNLKHSYSMQKGKIFNHIDGVGVTAIDYTETEFNAMIKEFLNEYYTIAIIIRKNITFKGE